MTRRTRLLKIPCCGYLIFSFFFLSCSNTPYPESEKVDKKTYYSWFLDPPKDLDPQRTYTSNDNRFLSLCYERLLGYSYLKRPLELEAELAKEVPVAQVKKNEKGEITEVRYHFDLQEGVYFNDDPCFPNSKGRELTADDFIYAFKRVAHPKTNCPVTDSFSHIRGFKAFRQRLKNSPDLNFEEIGEIEGIQKLGKYSFDIVLDHPYPQILYWLAMRFICALPHEAVTYYDGKKHKGEKKKRDTFRDHPVGTGPYRFVFPEYNREAKIVMERNPTWWGLMYPERKAPAIVYPLEPGEGTDEERGYWKSAWAGRPLARIDRIEWHIERENGPRFTKFLQGYHDASGIFLGIPTAQFDQIIQNDRLTPKIAKKGIRLVKDPRLDVYYIGFNMDDDDIGAPLKFSDPNKEAQRSKYLERNRKIRQAMTLAFNTKEYLRIFHNKIGISAESLLPPGLFGYDKNYKNPYRIYDDKLTRARELLVEAGLPNGIDPETEKPFRLTYDAGNTTTGARMIYNWYIDGWRKIGLDVELAATEYNKFQEKMYTGNFQLFSWGWLADYPDPENFLFLMYGPNSGKHNAHNPNHSWYENPAYDVLFKQMETLPNNQTRYKIIRDMIVLLQEDCPWIPMMHREDYILFHRWLKGAKSHPILSGGYIKYYDVDVELRKRLRMEWNRPIYWPGIIILMVLVLFFVPAVLSIVKERR